MIHFRDVKTKIRQALRETGRERWPQAVLLMVGAHLLWTHQTVGIRWEHLAGNGLFLALALAGARGREFTKLIAPLWLTGVAYESFHHLEQFRAHIRVDELYALEEGWFGIPTAQGTLIPGEFLARHTHAVLDLLTGFAYITYLYEPILVAFALYAISKPRMARLTWAFFLANLMGMATYLLYPAAPPWYITEYGFGPAVLDAVSSPAGAARFDDLLGINYFAGFYSRSANVFGAMPSLHVTYPIIVVAAVWGLGKRWVLSTTAFALLVAFSAVYLQHHYVWDVVIGLAYGVIAAAAVTYVQSRRVVRGKSVLEFALPVEDSEANLP